MRLYQQLLYLLSASYGLAHLLTTSRAKTNIDPTITAAPDISRGLLFRRAEASSQRDIRFVGWYSDGGSLNVSECATNAIWTQYKQGPYWDCCKVGDQCQPAISCVDGSLVVLYTSSGVRATTIACSEKYTAMTGSVSCASDLLYASSGAPLTGALTRHICRPNDEVSIFWQIKPESTSSISSTSSSSPSPSPPVEPPPPSKAWIAGAVVGPIIGLALIGAIVFFCLRHRKKKAALLHSPPMQHKSPVQNAALSYPVSPGPAPAYSSAQQTYSAIPYGGESSGATSPYQTQAPKQQWAQHAEQTHELLSPSPPSSPGPPQQQLAYNLNQGVSASGAEARTFSVELEDGGSRR